MPNRNKKKPGYRIFVGVTGASGSIYADRLIEQLYSKINFRTDCPISRIYVVVTDAGQSVVRHELKSESLLCRVINAKLTKDELNVIRYIKCDDLFAPCASGSSAPQAMVVLPCSMGSLGRMAHGISSNLLERSADVMLKQRRKLIICPRESPLNLIHLRNMSTLVEAGAEMLPLMPGFYQHPSSIDDLVNFCVGKILEQLQIEHELYQPWNSRMI